MKNSTYGTIWKWSFLSLAILALAAFPARAQTADLFLELEIAPNLSNSQVINITRIVSTRGKGPNLYSLFLQNQNSDASAEKLYFSRLFKSEKRGLIFELYQQQGQPFSLRPGQRVYATNKMLEDRLPGVKEDINFDGGLTAAGEEFLNELGGSTSLPPDRYTYIINVYQGNNSRNGGVLVASAQQEIGGLLVEDQRDFYLTSPGDAVGGGAEITNPYPEFRWEGSRGVDYRLVVVKAEGRESPESLLQGALSSAPIMGRGAGNNAAGPGTLLDYEVVDVRLRKTSYQFPPSGVQALKPGNTYYWQIFAEFQTGGTVDVRSSEIWSFTLASGSGALSASQREELRRILNGLSDNSLIAQLLRDGYNLGSVVIDGQTYAGTAALQKLTELLEQANEGEITIVNN